MGRSQDGASRRLRLLAPGPILAAVKAEGSRTADDGTTLWGAYDYESTYWTFSQTPALYYATWQQATTESVNNHLEDAADGFRPWESYQLGLHAAPHSFDAGDETAPWIEMTSDDWGCGSAWCTPQSTSRAGLSHRGAQRQSPGAVPGVLCQ